MNEKWVMSRRARRILFRGVPGATPRKRKASTKPSQVLIVCWGRRQVRLQILLHRCQQEQRHHLGVGDTDGIFWECQEIHLRNKNYLGRCAVKNFTLPSKRLELCSPFWEVISKPLECLPHLRVFTSLKAVGCADHLC